MGIMFEFGLTFFGLAIETLEDFLVDTSVEDGRHHITTFEGICVTLPFCRVYIGSMTEDIVG